MSNGRVSRRRRRRTSSRFTSDERGQAISELVITLPLIVGLLSLTWFIGSLAYHFAVFSHAAEASARLAITEDGAAVEAYLRKALSRNLGTPGDVAVEVTSYQGGGVKTSPVSSVWLDGLLGGMQEVKITYHPAVGHPALSGLRVGFRRTIVIDPADYRDNGHEKFDTSRSISLIVAGAALGHDR